MLSQKDVLETLLQHQSVQTQLLIEWVSQYVGQKLESHAPPVVTDGDSLAVNPEKFGAVRFDAGDSGPALVALAAAFNGKYSKRFCLNNRYALGQKIAFGNSVFILGNGQQLEEAGFSPWGAYAGVLLEGRDALTVLATAFFSGNRADNRFTHVALHQPPERKWLRLAAASFYGFDVGVKLQSHYHSIRDSLFASNNVGVLAQGAMSGNFYDCGSLSVSSCHFSANKLAGVQINGNVNDTVIRDCTFEGNLYHVVNGGGDVLLENCYLGDDPRFSLDQTAGNTTVVNPMRQPVHGGGYPLKPAGESPFVNWVTGAVRVSGGRVNLHGGSYDNCVYANVGYSNYGGVNGQMKGSVVVASGEARVSLRKVRSNVYSPLDFTGNARLVDCDEIPSYTLNGGLDDADRLPHDWDGAHAYHPTLKTAYGNRVLDLAAPGTVRFRVPADRVSSIMYLCVLVYKHTSNFPGLLWPGGANEALRSKGWQPVQQGSGVDQAPYQGNFNYHAGASAYMLVSPDYEGRFPYLNWIPVKITAQTGSFCFYASSTDHLLLGGAWLVGAEHFGEIAVFRQAPDLRRWSTAAPALGTWKAGDELDILPYTAGGFSRRVCTAAGTPGTWKGAGAIEA